MPWTGRDNSEPTPSLRLLGVRVVGPPPVDDVYFDLSGGFRALYGLNGAGKTRLLNAVSDLLAGRRHGDGYVIVQLDNAQDVDRSSPLVRELLSSASRRFEPDGPELPLSRIIAEMLGDPDRDDEQIFTLSSFLEEQGIWMLQPAGNESGWYAVPGFLADDGLIDRCGVPPQVASLLNSRNPSASAFDRALLGDPLLSCGPVAAAANAGDEHGTYREAAALAQSTRWPYPLVSFVSARAHVVGSSVQVADVVTNRELTPDVVTARTSELIAERLLDAGWVPLGEAIDGFLAGDREWNAEAPTAFASTVVATTIAEQMSETASELLSGALPGGLRADFRVMTENYSQALLSWRVSGEQHEDLDLTELSDAQRRWACLAIAYATNHQRRRQYVEDHPVVPEDQADLAEERERLEREISETRTQLADLEQARSMLEPDSDDDSDRFELIEIEFESLMDEVSNLEWELVAVVTKLGSLQRHPSRHSGEELLAEALKRQFELMPISLFLDEPEAGLHRTAERGVVQLLRSVARQQGFPVTVATHSPAFLEPGGADPLLVQRNERGHTVIDAGAGVLRRTAASLGINALDRLALYRTILLVEGRHDQIVLREFIGDELEDLRVLVVPLHGGRLMPTAADSLLLADFSDHRVFAMVDNADQTVFEELIGLARSLTPGDDQAYLAGSKEILASDKRSEHVFISRLIGRAHAQGLLERFGAIALTKGDILEYLPVEQFVAGAESWEALREVYSAQSSIRPFKTWAERKQRGDFSDEAIEQACRSMDSVPRDLQQVLNHLDLADPEQ
jgi:ABC-type lipoprotein export system ATPase subunit